MRKVRALPVDIITAQFTKQTLHQISGVIGRVIIFFLLNLFSDPYSKDDKCLWDPKKVSVTECKYDMFCTYMHSCIRFYELCCFCLSTIIFLYVVVFNQTMNDICCGLNLVFVQNFSNWFNFYFLLLCIHYHNVEQWQIKLKPVPKTLNQGQI